jgi:hypothetical protein
MIWCRKGIKQMKFKIGDKVRVKDDLIGGREYDSLWFAPDMERFRGYVMEIEEVRNNNRYVMKGVSYKFNDGMVESVESKKSSQNITYITDTLAITKIIYNDKATIVFFNDDTKQVVKLSEHDIYSEYSAVAIATMLKLTTISKTQFNKMIERSVEKCKKSAEKRVEKRYRN